MTTFTLDTHATIQELEAAGMDTRQAEVVVSAISRADAQVATKQDIALVQQDVAAVKLNLQQAVAAVKQDLQQDVAAVKHDLKQDIAELRADMAARETRLVKWAVALVGVAVAAERFLDWIIK